MGKITEENSKEITKEQLWEFIDYLCKYHENEMKRYEKEEKWHRAEFAKYLETSKYDSHTGSVHSLISSVQSLWRDAYVNSWCSMRMYYQPIADFIRAKDKYNKEVAFTLMMERFKECYGKKEK